MKKIVLAALVLLAVLRQDFFLSGRIEPLFLGFIPVGLAWHMLISLAAALLWWLVVTKCWPGDLSDAGGDSGQDRG